MTMGQARCQVSQLEPPELPQAHVRPKFAILKIFLLICVVIAQERRFGLKRLGTMINRTRHTSRPLDRAGSPEKRSRPNLNPLRRGTSTRDMQTIPSPQGSAVNLPPPPLPSQPIPPQPTIRTTEPELQPPQEPQRDDYLPNGDTSRPTPVRSSSLPGANGTHPVAVPTKSEENQSINPQGKSTEVRYHAQVFASPSLTGTEPA